LAPLIQSLFSALSGIRASLRRHEVSAHNVANLNTPGFRSARVEQAEGRFGGTDIVSISPEARALSGGGEPSDVDLAAEIANQILALRSLQANVAVLRTSDEMSEDLLDAL